MGWKILAVILAFILLTSIPDLFTQPQELRHWVGRAFSAVGLVGVLAYAFGWSILDQRFWFPFALAFAGWLTFGIVSSAATAWPLFLKAGSSNGAGLLVAIGIPVLVSVLQWLPVWRYANGQTVE
jgi:hypothetical protein